MIDNLQALLALSEAGTITKAASALHLTQSAVTKRIQNLEAEVGAELIERDGRNVILTHQGRRLLLKSRPLMAELREVLAEEVSEANGSISMTVSESILYSWGAKILAKVQEKIPEINLIINSDSCRIGLDKVLSGERMIAISPGKAELAKELKALPLTEEPMVIVPSGLEPLSLPRKGKLEVIFTEKGESTWVAVQEDLKAFKAKRGVKIETTKHVKTFSGVLKLAEAGFGHGFVPLGVAKAFKIPDNKLLRLPKPGIKRSASLVGRPTTLNRKLVPVSYTHLTLPTICSV